MFNIPEQPTETHGINILCARSHKPGRVIHSSTGGEVLAIKLGAVESKHLADILSVFNFGMNLNIYSVSDSRNVVVNAKSLGNLEKNIRADYFLVRSLMETEKLTIQHVRGWGNPSDILTKPMGECKISIYFSFVAGILFFAPFRQQYSEEPIDEIRKIKPKVWVRKDLGVKNFQLTKRGAPDWGLIYRRLTYNLDSNELIDVVFVKEATRQELERPLPEGISNIKSVFEFAPVNLNRSEHPNQD